MGRIILTTILLLWAVPTMAADLWCQWDGTTVMNCQSDYRGYIIIEGFPRRTPSIINSKNFFKVVETDPAKTKTQINGDEIFNKVGNEITKTWAVVEAPPEEKSTIATKDEIVEIYAVLVDKLGVKPEDIPHEKADALTAKQAEWKQ